MQLGQERHRREVCSSKLQVITLSCRNSVCHFGFVCDEYRVESLARSFVRWECRGMRAIQSDKSQSKRPSHVLMVVIFSQEIEKELQEFSDAFGSKLQELK